MQLYHDTANGERLRHYVARTGIAMEQARRDRVALRTRIAAQSEEAARSQTELERARDDCVISAFSVELKLVTQDQLNNRNKARHEFCTSIRGAEIVVLAMLSE